ncbi:MAG: C_GCAxxG_C_C family protein [Clostridia bacterium]|nr:C_GCAxxG_C_C family protein [Clostridia bacterium]
MDKSQIASKYYQDGNNCAQAVVLAFQQEMSMDQTTLKKLALGFGGGVARLQNACGAVLGMVMVLSYLKGTDDKLASYEFIRGACKEFEEKVGSIICKNIKQIQQENAQFYNCADVCGIAAKITQDYLAK